MPLTTAQKVTLKADIVAKQAVAQPLFGVTNEQVIADYYNAAPGTFIVWKSSVELAHVGAAFNSVELAGLSTANTNRLQVMAAYSGGVFSPALADMRAGFDSIYSGAGGALTRAALLALWKRAARRVEALFATGTGTDAAPATLVYEDQLTAQVVSDVIAGL